MGGFRVPRCAILQFTKLVDLALNETDGLMRDISEAAVTVIKEDMVRVGVVKEKFGRPTINISCEMSDDIYRSLFHPVPSGDLHIVNEEIDFLNMEGIPLLLPTVQLTPHLNFTDGRHRVMACSQVVQSEELRSQFVLCFVTNIKEPLSMKQDSFRKSEIRPLVFDSIHDVLVCLPHWESGDTSKIRQAIRNVLKICVVEEAKKIENLHCHIFERSRRLLDTHRDTNLFSRDNLFKRSSLPFISFIKESGKGQYAGYRYEFRSVFGSESGLKAREMVQCGVIQAMVFFARYDCSIGAIKILANAPKLGMEHMKKCRYLSETDLVKFFVDLLREIFMFFNKEANGNGPELTTSSLKIASSKVLVEGLGLAPTSLQEYLNRCTISTTDLSPRSHGQDGNVTGNESVEKNSNTRTTSKDPDSIFSAKTAKSGHRKRSENLVDDRIEKKKKKCYRELLAGRRDKSAIANVSASPSARALCAAKCLDYSEEMLKDIYFFPFKCRDKRYVIDGMKKLETASKAILFIDATFLKRGETEKAVLALSQCNVEVEKILFWSTEAVMGNSILVPGFSVRLESKLSVAASEGDGNLGASYYAQILLPLEVSYEGPSSTTNRFVSGVREMKVFEWFLSTAFSCIRKPSDFQCPVWVDFTVFSQVVVLEHLLQHDFEAAAAYYKISNEDSGEGLENVNCLLALRRKVSILCSCGGHSILSASNHAELNELGEEMPRGADHSHGEYPFIMYGHGKDEMPNGNVFEHPSLLLKSNVLGNTSVVTQDPKMLCLSRRDKNGILLHRGAFVTKETFENLKSKRGNAELILPSTTIMDGRTKKKKFPFCISEFEMRDWFVSGLTDQLFSVVFPDNSVASLLNEGAENSEVTFIPRHRSVEYLDILFREGLQAVKRPELCLIYCQLDFSALSAAESRGLRCKHCNAVELLTHYGSEYVHE